MGPGIITMVADNDAGGISTYAQTGVKTGFNLLWAFLILVPMAYYVQEMTVRLDAVTKRGHAEASSDPGFELFQKPDFNSLHNEAITEENSSKPEKVNGRKPY